MWKYRGPPPEGGPDSETNWLAQNPSKVSGAVKQVTWGSQKELLAVNSVRDVFILSEQTLCAHFKDQVTSTTLFFVVYVPLRYPQKAVV